MRYFLVAALTHHVHSWLTLSGQFTTVGACPRAQRGALVATLMAQHGGDHGVDIDEFTVREERGEEEHCGVQRSHRVTVYLCYHQGGAVLSVDAQALPRTDVVTP